MRAGSCLRAMLACGLVAVAPAPAQDDGAAVDKPMLQRWEKQFQESLGWYQLSGGPKPGAVLKPQSVLRWVNPTRGQKGEPTLVFWIGGGRPEALSSVYPWGKFLMYECVSLARDEGLIAREGDRTVWSPVPVGVTLRDVPDAPSPAETPILRLQQAKAFAERFKVSIVATAADGRETREAMRLLPKPIYRYDMAQAKAAHPGLVDGAVFAFVQGTDPEAVLMIEAVRKGDGLGWQYAFGRSTGYPMEARLGPSVVWTAPALASWGDPMSTTKTLGRPLVE